MHAHALSHANFSPTLRAIVTDSEIKLVHLSPAPFVTTPPYDLTQKAFAKNGFSLYAVLEWTTAWGSLTDNPLTNV